MFLIRGNFVIWGVNRTSPQIIFLFLLYCLHYWDLGTYFFPQPKMYLLWYFFFLNGLSYDYSWSLTIPVLNAIQYRYKVSYKIINTINCVSFYLTLKFHFFSLVGHNLVFAENCPSVKLIFERKSDVRFLSEYFVDNTDNITLNY